MYDQHGLYLNGTWYPPGTAESFAVIDPATEAELGRVPVASEAQLDAAIAGAEAAMVAWRQVDAWRRGAYLSEIADRMLARRDEAARRITLEVGKPLAQSAREWQLAADQFRWFGEETKRLYGRIVESRLPNGQVQVTREPVGVVAAFTAWNFPAALLARKLAPALAAGCAVICRPSSEAPGTAMLLAACCDEAGLPGGLVNLLCGPASQLSSRLLAAPQIRKISLTGSTDLGKRLTRAAAETLKRVSMELGGNAPVVVCADADIPAAVSASVATKFANAGQVCVAPDRFLIQRSVFDAFVDQFTAAAAKLKLGHGLDPDTQMGPLTTARRWQAVQELIEDSRAAGGTILCGGGPPPDLNRGYFLAPSVIVGLDDDARAVREETFAPVAVMAPFDDLDEAVARANRSEYGLSAYVWTGSPATGYRLRDALEAGMVGVNTYALANAEVPFGGIKASGMGREGGAEGIEDYLNVKLAHLVLEEGA